MVMLFFKFGLVSYKIMMIYTDSLAARVEHRIDFILPHRFCITYDVQTAVTTNCSSILTLTNKIFVLNERQMLELFAIEDETSQNTEWLMRFLQFN